MAVHSLERENVIESKAKSIFKYFTNVLKSADEHNFILLLFVLDKKGVFDGSNNEDTVLSIIDGELSFKDWINQQQIIIDEEIIKTTEGIDSKNSCLFDYVAVKGLHKVDPEKRDKFFSKRTDKPVQDLKNLFENFPRIEKEELPDLFEHYLKLISKYEGRKSGEYFQPEELTKFVCSLVNLPENASVYNPFAGYASFGVGLRNFKRYVAQDIDERARRIGMLRLMMHGMDQKSLYLKGDSITNYNPTNEAFDLIIAFPPHHLKADDSTLELEFDFLDSLYDEGFLIDLVNKPGTRAYILQRDFFYELYEENFNYFFDPNNGTEVHKIISLPSGILRNSNISLILVLLSNNRRRNIEFVDGTDCFIKDGRKRILDCDKLLSRVNNNDPSHVKIVSLEDIFAANNNLNPKRYLLPNVDGVSLGDIASIVNESITKEEKGKELPMVEIANLKNDPIDFYIELKDLESSEPTPLYEKIEGPVLLVSTLGEVNPTYCNDAAEFYIPSRVVGLKFDLSKINVGYFVGELYKEYVIDQYMAFQIQGRISPDDLLKIKINLPELKEQISINDGYRVQYFRSKKNEFERRLKEVKSDEFRNISSLTHSINNYLNNIKNIIEGTLDFVKSNDGKPIGLYTIYSPKLNQTFEDHLLNANQSIAYISKLLERIDDSSSHQPKHIVQSLNLVDLVKLAMRRFEKVDKFEFRPLHIDENSFEINGKTIEPIVKITEEDFFDLFQNIVKNADDHGFRETNKRYIISISLEYNTKTSMCKLEVSNNGLPFHEGFHYENLVTIGDKTADSKGTGMGGHDIKVITEKYGGKFELINEPDNDFPVSYLISLPLVKS